MAARGARAAADGRLGNSVGGPPANLLAMSRCKSRSSTSSSREINEAFATMVRERPDALLVGTGPLFTSWRVQLVQLAIRHAVPAIYVGRQYAEIGGQMSYGASLTDAYRQMGVYAGRIFKDAKPADLPVVQSTKFELVIRWRPPGCSASRCRPGCSRRHSSTIWRPPIGSSRG